MRRDVAPVIGHLHPRDITPALVLKAVAPITARDAIETVHRTVEMIGQTFTYAIAMGDCETNPARGLSIVLPDAPKPVHRPALIDDVGLGHFLDDLWSWPHGGAGQALLQIGLLTAQRPGEVRQMKWSDLDLEAGRWTFDVSKTGLEGHITPLSRQAVGILKAQPRIAGSDYVFPNATTKRPVSDVLVSHLIARLGYAGRMSAHGARAAFRTIGVERLGFPEPAVEMQIAHRPRDIHGAAYNRAIWLHERIQMMQTWADYLDHVRRDAHAKRRGQAPKMAAE
jgi:integrase